MPSGYEEVIINDEILLKSIVNDEENEEVVKEKGSSDLVSLVPEVQALKLSFSQISVVTNLSGFDQLIKLCLDNNSIKEIDGLDHLVHLEWLDLSFNQISSIRGLDKLTQLKDVSLFSNQITTIEGGFDKCGPSLECLSLGNNQISSLDEILVLRPFCLKMLTLSGNPVCEEVEYKTTALAFLTNLCYLDYEMVQEREVISAKEQYQDELIDLEDKEGVEREKILKDDQLQEQLGELRVAGIEFAMTSFDDMFSDDTELNKLKHLPGVNELIEQFRSSFKELSDQFIQVGQENYSKKKELSDSYQGDMSSLDGDSNGQSISLMDEFQKFYKRFTKQITDNEEITSAELADLYSRLEVLADILMQKEMKRVDVFERLTDDYEGGYSEIKGVCLDMQQQFFRAVEKQQESFTSDVKQLAFSLMDQLAKEEMSDAFLDDEAVMLLSDRESCTNVVVGSHELHTTRLMKKEDEERNNEISSFSKLFRTLREDELSRNRKRILEIFDFGAKIKRDVEELTSPLRDDDE